jgi:hypothetical protein
MFLEFVEALDHHSFFMIRKILQLILLPFGLPYIYFLMHGCVVRGLELNSLTMFANISTFVFRGSTLSAHFIWRFDMHDMPPSHYFLFEGSSSTRQNPWGTIARQPSPCHSAGWKTLMAYSDPATATLSAITFLGASLWISCFFRSRHGNAGEKDRMWLEMSTTLA